MTKDPPNQPPSESEGPIGGLLRHSAIYSAAPILRQLIAIGMTRFYTGWLEESGYGVKEVVDLWLIAIQQLVGINILGAMMRFYFDHKGDEERARVISSCSLLVTASAWILCGSLALFSDSLAPLMLGHGEGTGVGGPELASILTVALLLIPFQMSSAAGFYYLMILKRSSAYTVIHTVKLLFEVGMNFWLIGGLGMGVRGFLLSMMAGEILASLGLTIWMLNRVRPRISWRILKPILVYALPLIPVGVCQFGLHQVDRRLILHFAEEGTGQAMAGIYGLGYKIGYLTTPILLGPFMQIWQPWIFSMRDPGERARLIARVSTYAVFAVAVASMGVIFFGREGVLILDGSGSGDFHDAYAIIPLIAGSYVFWGLYQAVQIPLFIAKRTMRLFGVNLIALITNVSLNAWLIPEYGVTGAAIATLATFTLLASLGLMASRSEAHVPFEMQRILGTLAWVVVAGIIASTLDARTIAGVWSFSEGIALKTAAMVLCTVLLITTVLRNDERTDAWAWMRARMGLGT